MADAPQGEIVFNGIDGLISGGFSLTHGIAPSLCEIIVAPSQKNLKAPVVGTLQLKYGGLNLKFPDACVVELEPEIGRDGREMWRITLADTRWRWRFPVISGEYNIRTTDQQIKDAPRVKLRSKKSARELAKLLAAKLKIRQPDLRTFPDDAFPEVRWDYSRADQALGNLCELYGLRVVLNAGNAVTFPKQGEGKQLPESDDATDASATFEAMKRPPSITWAGGPDIYQVDFELEPVAREVNGDYVELDKVSYTPRGSGWRAVDFPAFLSIKDLKARNLAADSVFRAYRIKAPFKLPFLRNPVDFLWRILPLHSTQLDKGIVSGVYQELPPWIYGVYFEGAQSLTDNEEFQARQRLGDTANYPNGLWKRGFELDAERGVVVLSEPCYRVVPWGGGVAGVAMIPAALRLRIGFSLRDEDSGAWIHRELVRAVPKSNVDTDPLTITTTELCYREGHTWRDGQQVVIDNDKEWTNAGNEYIDAELKRLEAASPAAVSYAGFKDLKLDGAIQQVAWRIGDDGRAMTQASRNTERAAVAISFKEKRLQERLVEAIAKAARPRGPLAPWVNQQ